MVSSHQIGCTDERKLVVEGGDDGDHKSCTFIFLADGVVADVDGATPADILDDANAEDRPSKRSKRVNSADSHKIGHAFQGFSNTHWPIAPPPSLSSKHRQSSRGKLA